jgi:hypothetical protein
MPWQDLPISDWIKALEQYKRGKMKSKAKTFGQRVGYIFKCKYPLPRTIRTLDMQIRHYHKTERRSVENLQRRAGALRIIAGLGRSFLAEHDIPDKNVLKQSMEEKKYKAYKKQTLDYAVSKVVRRAERKAEYIEKLKQHIDNADKGFTGKGCLLQYIRKTSFEPVDNNLVRMGPEVVLEKIDPWHRDYESSFNMETMIIAAPRGSSIFAAAFKQWTYDSEHPDLPFFVWLEGHYICTNDANPQLLEYKRLTDQDGNIDYDMPESRVIYNRYDRDPSDTPLISLQNGMLRKYHINSDGNMEDDGLYNTQYSDHPEARGGKGLGVAHAYVWSKDGLIFAGTHIGHMFHHSSFVSGKKVRCAGMIRVTNGKVTKVDNDSGHYKPETRHLKNFVQFLSINNAFTEDARVEDKSVKPDFRANVKDFLAGDRTMVIRRDLEAIKTKKTTLRELVEKRFQEMKEEIGPAPEHALWTRAYKAVCLEFGTIEPSWNRKANAPPIPRSKVSRRR